MAEIEFGMAKVVIVNTTQRDAVRQFFRENPWHLGIDDGTIESYAMVRAKLWEKYGTRKPRGHHEKLPDELCDRSTAKWVGIDERDLLIVSVALQYNLLFATLDRNLEMRRIEEAVAELVSETKLPAPLRLVDWTPP